MIDISSFGLPTSSKYYISLQSDSGPQSSLYNMCVSCYWPLTVTNHGIMIPPLHTPDRYLYTGAGIVPEIYRKVRCSPCLVDPPVVLVLTIYPHSLPQPSTTSYNLPHCILMPLKVG